MGSGVIVGSIAHLKGRLVAWELRNGRRFYYRAVRREGRTIEEYVGRGPAAEMASRLDARARRDRDQAARELKAEKVRCGPADRATKDFEAVFDLMVSASLHGAGFHRHRSGPWRRRRRHGRPTAVE
jgi:hypothetical protein